MVAVGGAAFPVFYRPQQLFLPHNPLYALAIYPISIRRAPQLATYSPRSISDILPCDFFQIRHQFAFIGFVTMIMIGAARQTSQLAGLADWVLVPLVKVAHHYPFSFGG
jgi:hypothetical protein